MEKVYTPYVLNKVTLIQHFAVLNKIVNVAWLHENCNKIHTKQFIQILNNKVNTIADIKDQVTKLFNNLRQKFVQIQKWITKIIQQQSLTNDQMVFIQYMHQDRAIKIKGKLIIQMCYSQNYIEIDRNYLMEVQKQVKNLWQTKGDVVWEVLNQTKEIYKTMKRIKKCQKLSKDQDQQLSKELTDLMNLQSANQNKLSKTAKQLTKQDFNYSMSLLKANYQEQEKVTQQKLKQEQQVLHQLIFSQDVKDILEQQQINQVAIEDIQFNLQMEKAKFISSINRNNPDFKKACMSLLNLGSFTDYQKAEDFVLYNGFNKKGKLLVKTKLQICGQKNIVIDALQILNNYLFE